MRFLKNFVLFCIGGSAYVGLELLWRRRSHGSMFLLGGACFLVIGKLGHLLGRASAALQAVVSACAVTGMELLAGLVVNRRYRVWDYRRLRWNYRGQICLLYALFWVPVSAFAGALYRLVEKRLPFREA